MLALNKSCWVDADDTTLMAESEEELKSFLMKRKEESEKVGLKLNTPFEDLGCFSGCLMSSASIQKLFCGMYSAFKCSFDEFVGEKVFSPSYSSAILAPPLPHVGI